MVTCTLQASFKMEIWKHFLLRKTTNGHHPWCKGEPLKPFSSPMELQTCNEVKSHLKWNDTIFNECAWRNCGKIIRRVCQSSSKYSCLLASCNKQEITFEFLLTSFQLTAGPSTNFTSKYTSILLFESITTLTFSLHLSIANTVAVFNLMLTLTCMTESVTISSKAYLLIHLDCLWGQENILSITVLCNSLIFVS